MATTAVGGDIAGRLALATHAADIGVWDWDLRTGVLDFSARAREICGLPPPPAPVKHADVVRATHRDDRAANDAIRERALDPACRARARYEYRVVRPDGTVRWVLAHGEATFAQVDGCEQAVRYVGTVQDVTERRRLREALVESERRLRLAVDAARIAVWEVDIATDTLVGSPELNRMLGFPPDARPGMADVRAGYLPGERDRMREASEAAQARGERFFEVAFRFRWPNGEIRSLQLRAERQRDDDGQPARVVGVLIDQTERRRAEEALRTTQAGLQLTQRVGNVGVWDWDLVTDQITWSPETYALLGLDPDVDGNDPFQAWLRVLHPADRERALERLRQVREQGWGDWYEFRICRADDGEVRWIRAYGTALEDESGRQVRIIGVNLDVTDLHQQQQALEYTNRALREVADRNRRERERLFEISQDLIASAGFDGYMRLVNPAWRRVLGYDETYLLETPFIELVHPDDRDIALQAIEMLHQGQRPPRAEVRMRRSDGAWRWISWAGVAEGELLYAVGRDITQQQQAAQELADANRNLRTQIRERERVERTLRQMQRLEAVGQLTAGVSHDFNNLLTVILGNIDVLEDTAGDPRLKQRLGLMRQAAMRGATLTAQLLAFSRRQRLEPKPIDLNETVQGMSELLKSTMGGSVRLETVCEPDLWQALVDPTQIELVILNLAINARDAMPVGGSLTIRTANVQWSCPPEVPGEPGPGEFVVIAVADTGAGMSAETRARAFEPFFTTKDVGKGSGLGLAQVLGFAQQSGGGVRIESTPGAGTTVSVYLPRARALDATIPDASRPAGDQRDVRRDHCVLLVDDDDAVREVTALKLREMGLRVIEAASGQAALDALAEAGAVDLLVADFAMPGMNGAEVARRARTRHPALPVLFVTGYADQSELAGSGDARVVQKPFRDDELQREVRALLTGPG